MYHLVPDEVVVRYLEPHRHYHTLEHIYNGLSVIDMLAAAVGLPETDTREVKRAWWFHDAIYDIPALESMTNEERSARLAEATFPYYVKTPEGTINGKAIANLVRVTIYPNLRKDHSPAEAIINDADLFGFASPKAVYDHHTAQIRLEAPSLSDKVFNEKRKAFLANLVEKQSPLFKTSLGLKLWEAKALNNIYREIYST